MKQNNLQGGLKKATIEMVSLNLLSESDKYGYELSQECKKRTDGQYSILEGSMYPILYRLEDAGLISHYEKKSGRRMIRVYYHLETGGKERLLEQKREYTEYLALINGLLGI